MKVKEKNILVTSSDNLINLIWLKVVEVISFLLSNNKFAKNVNMRNVKKNCMAVKLLNLIKGCIFMDWVMNAGFKHDLS